MFLLIVYLAILCSKFSTLLLNKLNERNIASEQPKNIINWKECYILFEDAENNFFKSSITKNIFKF